MSLSETVANETLATNPVIMFSLMPNTGEETGQCKCNVATQRTFESVRDGIAWGRTDVLHDAVEIARSEKKWIFLLRCGACRKVWAEACWSSGHMEIYYIFPVPAGEDPLDWLEERAEALEWDAKGPVGVARPPSQP